MGFFTGEVGAKPIILLTGVRFVRKLNRDSISSSNKLSASLTLNTRYRYSPSNAYITIFVSMSVKARYKLFERFVKYVFETISKTNYIYKCLYIYKFADTLDDFYRNFIWCHFYTSILTNFSIFWNNIFILFRSVQTIMKNPFNYSY